MSPSQKWEAFVLVIAAFLAGFILAAAALGGDKSNCSVVETTDTTDIIWSTDNSPETTDTGFITFEGGISFVPRNYTFPAGYEDQCDDRTFYIEIMKDPKHPRSITITEETSRTLITIRGK
jgi:hypothetical protein